MREEGRSEDSLPFPSPSPKLKKRMRKNNEKSIASKTLHEFEQLQTVVDDDDDVSTVQYKCSTHTSTGGHKHNLTRHLKNVHPDIYIEKIDPQNHPNAMGEKRLKLLQNLTEIVSVNGRPFNYLLDSGFMKVIKEDLQELEDAGCPLTMEKNLPEVKDYLSEAAQCIRKQISKEVDGRALSLVVDIGSKNNRSIFGAALQYVFNGKLRVRTICMLELTNRHTGEYLADIVKKILELYNVNLEQILVITTDNGSNVLKMVRDIDSILKNNTSSTEVQL